MIDLKYLYQDDKDSPIGPSYSSIVFRSCGEKIFARGFIPALDREGEKRPAVLLMHGFPGNERLRDLAQALRRVGFSVVTGGYRGVWGCGGDYRLSQLTYDCRENLKYVKEHADELAIDTERIYLVGHSMGGFTTMRLLAEGIDVKGAMLLSPCDMTELYLNNKKGFKDLVDESADFFTLSEEGPAIFARECEEHKAEWHFPVLAEKLPADMPLAFIGSKFDGCCPPPEHVMPTLEVLERRGIKPFVKIFDTDHCYQNVRLEFIETVARWLMEQEGLL